MRLSNDIIAQVGRVARIFYVDRTWTKNWNDNRRGDELRMFTGWSFVARNGSETRQGMKTYSVAVREAYYTLVMKTEVPVMKRAKLRVISSRKAA